MLCDSRRARASGSITSQRSSTRGDAGATPSGRHAKQPLRTNATPLRGPKRSNLGATIVPFGGSKLSLTFWSDLVLPLTSSSHACAMLASCGARRRPLKCRPAQVRRLGASTRAFVLFVPFPFAPVPLHLALDARKRESHFSPPRAPKQSREISGEISASGQRLHLCRSHRFLNAPMMWAGFPIESE